MMSHFQIHPLRGAAIVLLTVATLLSFFASCTREKKDLVEYTFDSETSYTLKETTVETLISDSGVTRYRLVTDTWLMFGKAAEPYWYFPDGIYLEQFDTVFNVQASIKADTAYYYERRKLWELNGNVDISNHKGERFQTSQLFWDDNKNSIYSDSFIRITNGDRVNTGIGFQSNEDMTVYEIYKAAGDIPVETQRRATSADSLSVEPQNGEIAPETPVINPSDTLISDKNELLELQERE